VKIYIILLSLFLDYNMSCVCRLSVCNACTMAKRYVVGITFKRQLKTYTFLRNIDDKMY